MLLNTGRRPCGSKDARGLGGKGGDNINEDQVAGGSGYPTAMCLSSSPAADAVAVVTEEGRSGDPTSSSFSISTSARVRALDARRRGFRVVVAGAEVAVAAAGQPVRTPIDIEDSEPNHVRTPAARQRYLVLSVR